MPVSVSSGNPLPECRTVKTPAAGGSCVVGWVSPGQSASSLVPGVTSRRRHSMHRFIAALGVSFALVLGTADAALGDGGGGNTATNAVGTAQANSLGAAPSAAASTANSAAASTTAAAGVGTGGNTAGGTNTASQSTGTAQAGGATAGAAGAGHTGAVSPVAGASASTAGSNAASNSLATVQAGTTSAAGHAGPLHASIGPLGHGDANSVDSRFGTVQVGGDSLASLGSGSGSLFGAQFGVAGDFAQLFDSVRLLLTGLGLSGSRGSVGLAAPG